MSDIRITEADCREIRRIRQKVDNLRGPGVKNTHNAITIAAAAAADVRPAAQFRLPAGGLKYQVLMRIDDAGTPGWDYPRMH